MSPLLCPYKNHDFPPKLGEPKAFKRSIVKYFITGATGFIGGRLARQLREAGHDVVAAVRDPAKAGDLSALGVQLATGDVTDKESLRKPMTGVDGVFHVAGWYKIGIKGKDAKTADGWKINVDGTRNVLELMQALGISRGVYTSSLAVNSDTHGVEVDERYRFTGQHISVYDETKALAHDLAEAMMRQGLPLVIVQPGVVYGPGDTSSMRSTIIQVLQRKLPMMPRGTAFSWAHVDDVAQAHILAMNAGKPGENYFVCGPTHTFVEGMAIVTQTAQVQPPGQIAPGVLKAMAGVMSVVENVVTVPEAYTSEGLRVIAGTTYIGTNAKARRELGYNPRPLQEGLAETVRHEMGLLLT